MDKKDVAGITIDKSFNKKWWDGHRGLKARGSGTGEVLAEWQKNCPKDVSTLSAAGIDVAEKTADALRKTLKVASGKCGKSDQDTIDGIKKMLGLADGYETELANHKKTIVNTMMKLTTSLDEVCKVIGEQAIKLEKAVPELKLISSRVEHYGKDAKGSLVENDKKILLKDLETEKKLLEKFRKEVALLPNMIKSEEQKCAAELKLARGDGRFRPIVMKYDKARAEFDKSYKAGYDESLEVDGHIEDVVVDLTNAGTADAAIKVVSNIVEMLNGSPNLETFGSTLDLLKRWTTPLIKFTQAPTSLTPADWKEATSWEFELGEQMGNVEQSTRELQRMMNQVTKTAGRFPNVVPLEKAVVEAKKAAAVRLKERSDLLKFAPAFEKQLKSLLEHQP